MISFPLGDPWVGSNRLSPMGWQPDASSQLRFSGQFMDNPPSGMVCLLRGKWFSASHHQLPSATAFINYLHQLPSSTTVINHHRKPLSTIVNKPLLIITVDISTYHCWLWTITDYISLASPAINDWTIIIIVGISYYSNIFNQPGPLSTTIGWWSPFIHHRHLPFIILSHHLSIIHHVEPLLMNHQ